MDDWYEPVLSLHGANFDHSLRNASELVRLHDEERARKRESLPNQLEALIRSALILSVTTWEAFIEDVLRSVFKHRLSVASNASEVENTFMAVASAWLNPEGKDRPKPAELMRWTGDGWKDVLTTRLTEEIASLNTPNSQRIKKLSKRWLGWDLTSCWQWGSVSAASACSQLDALISRRGDLVHRPRDVFDFDDKGALRKEAEDAIELVAQLKKCSVEGLLAHRHG
jgi:hypothetical protein